MVFLRVGQQILVFCGLGSLEQPGADLDCRANPIDCCVGAQGQFFSTQVCGN